MDDHYDNLALLYDSIYLSQRNDVGFYCAQARKAGGRVLELACGTGRIYLRLLRMGVDAYGLDISPKMLQVLRASAIEQGLFPKVKKGDMRSFSYPFRFSLIIIPFRAFLHLLSSEDKLAALRCIRQHLAPKGRLILNFFAPSPRFISENYWKWASREVGGQERLCVRSKTSFSDDINQVVRVDMRVLRRGRQIGRGAFRIALIHKQEFELLLRLAGFSSWHVYGGFKKNRLVSSKQEMVWVVEK